SLFAWGQSRLTRAEGGASRIDLYALVGAAVAAAADAAARKQLALRNECAGIYAGGDKDVVAAILRNLLDNAIKFSHPGGVVVVRAREVGARVDVSVADSGVGIAEETMSNLFR